MWKNNKQWRRSCDLQQRTKRLTKEKYKKIWCRVRQLDKNFKLSVGSFLVQIEKYTGIYRKKVHENIIS